MAHPSHPLHGRHDGGMWTTNFARLFTLVALLASCALLAAGPLAPVAEGREIRRGPETLRLSCAPDAVDGERGITCRWSEAVNPDTRGYRLYRSTDGGGRELVASVGADGPLGHFDTDVKAPSTQVYGVVAVNRVGRVLGRSAPVRVVLGSAEALRLACCGVAAVDTAGSVLALGGPIRVDWPAGD